MAITRGVTTGKVQTGTLTFPSLPTVGDLIVVEFVNWNGGGVSNACTDNQGNVYKMAVRVGPNSLTRSIIYYAENIRLMGGGTFTITIDAETTSFCLACATAYHGFTGYNLLDKVSSATGSSTTPSTGSTAATAQADTLAVAMLGVGGAIASITVESVSPAWNQDCEELSFSIIPGEGDSRILSSTGAQSCSWTLASSQPWVATIATFRAVGDSLPDVLIRQVKNTGISTVDISTPIALSFNVTASHAIVVVASYTNNGSVINSISDTQGNTYVAIRRYPQAATNPVVDVWAAFNAYGGSCTVTIHVSGSARTGFVSILEVRGLLGGSSYVEGATTSTTTHQVSNLASSGSALFLEGGTYSSGIAVGTEADGFNRRGHLSNLYYLQTREVADAQTTDGSWTSSAAISSNNLLVLFEGTATDEEDDETPTITIAGVLSPIRRHTLNISEVANGRNTLTCEVRSTDGTYRPAPDSEVVVRLAGVRVFAGTIKSTREYGITGPFGVAIWTYVSVNDFNSLPDNHYYSGTLAAGTLKSQFTTLVDLMADNGVTLDGSQVDGPAMPEVTYSNRQVTEIFGDLAVVAGAQETTPTTYVWEIDYDKVARMYVPGTVPSPFDVINNNGNAIGDIVVSHDSRVGYANRIILQYGSPGQKDWTDQFTGNGSQTAFPLTNTPMDGNWATYRSLVISNNGVSEPVQSGGPPVWTFTDSPPTVTRSSAPANGNTILVRYWVQFPQTVTAEDTSEQVPPVGIVTKLVEKLDVFDRTVAQAYADAELAIGLERGAVSVTYNTRRTGLKPGMTQTITVTRRNVNDTFLVSDIRSLDLGDAPGTLLRQVTATQGTTLKPSWREFWKNLGTSGGPTSGVGA